MSAQQVHRTVQGSPLGGVDQGAHQYTAALLTAMCEIRG